MSILKKIIAVLLYLLSFQAVGTPLFGGSSSGGGGYYLDKLNPWFLQNRETVEYSICIARDFPFTEESVSSAVLAAIRYWKGEFARVNEYQSQVMPYKVGTQSWQKISCASKADVTFYFGYLPQEYGKILHESIDYLAFALRTEYDTYNLAGKGLVYFSRKSVELLFALANGQLNGKIDPGARFRVIIFHELGHIFGVPHSGGTESLMGETLAEYLTEETRNTTYDSSDWSMDYFTYNRNLQKIICHFVPDQVSFFQIKDQECLKISFENKYMIISKGNDDNWRDWARFELLFQNEKQASYSTPNRIYVSKPNCIDSMFSGQSHVFYQPHIEERHFQGYLNGIDLPLNVYIYLLLAPGHLRIEYAKNYKIEPLLRLDEVNTFHGE